MKTRMDYCENIFQKGVTSLMYLKNTSRKCMTSLIRDLENVLDIKHHMKSTILRVAIDLTIRAEKNNPVCTGLS